MKKTFQNILLACASVILCLLFFELTLRLFIKPSPKCYGVLFNTIELPPFKIETRNLSHDSYEQPWENLTIGGKRITRGDMLGICQKNPVSGFAPIQNAVSLNGWWRSNNLGARSSTDTQKDIPPGMRRVIIFGDSFTNCNGVPGEGTWPFFLNNKSENTEFINFGVGGYGMGQCLLRYEDIRNKIKYNLAMLVFVPTADLQRDINVARQFCGWRNFSLMPRFIIKNGRLKLIENPYRTPVELERDNKIRLSDRTREHLRAYDRFYFRSKYESPPFWGNFILYKLWARASYIYQNKSLLRNLLSPSSEAMLVSSKIFEKMNEESSQDGGKFILVILPYKTNVLKYGKDRQFQQRYDKMVSSIEDKGILCIDLMKDLSKIDPKQMDMSYDKMHYGAVSNGIIAGILRRRLKDLKWISTN